jgi:tetraacyldisaccharide 4'-kinase
MREPLKAGLARADAVVLLLPSDMEAPDDELIAQFTALPVLIARLEAAAPPPTGPQLGFAGVAKPWKVERALRAAGCDLIDFASFPDHAAFDEGALRALQAVAEDQAAGLVTTEKDWVRLPATWRERVAAWPVRARFEDEAAFRNLVHVKDWTPPTAKKPRPRRKAKPKARPKS